ncbi:MAG: hypothetical protein RPU39_13465 [Candidatus Sedimenticola sp. (ex Thyasira tokunagai)]
MTEAKQWVLDLEKSVFPTSATKPHSDEFAANFIANATLLNEMMSPYYDNYVSRIVRSSSGMWTDLNIKSFIVSGYPSALLEPAFKDEYAQEIRKLAVGLYPFDGGREINAVTKVAPDGKTKAIFFSEWLFAFLWDLYHQPTAPDQNTSNAKQALKRSLINGHYKNINIESIRLNSEQGSYGKFDMLWGLMLLWGHELGHAFLGHCEENSKDATNPILTDAAGTPNMAFNQDQQMELDADMFAMDLIVRYLEHGFTVYAYNENGMLSVNDIHENALWKSMSFFRLMAEIEAEKSIDHDPTSDYPLGAFRMIFMFLRHEKTFRHLGWNKLADDMLRRIDKGELPAYDFTKNIPISHMLR